MNTTAERTEKLQRGRPFKPGQSGNPAGRPRGSRNRITTAVLEIVERQIAKSVEPDAGGSLEELREKHPEAFWRFVASLVPKELDVDTRPPVEFTMILHDAESGKE